MNSTPTVIEIRSRKDDKSPWNRMQIIKDNFELKALTEARKQIARWRIGAMDQKSPLYGYSFQMVRTPIERSIYAPSPDDVVVTN